MLNAEGQYVLFVCKGVAEQYILTTLIERGELTIPADFIVPNQLRGTWYFTRKESKQMLDRFLNMSYGEHPLLIVRIVDEIFSPQTRYFNAGLGRIEFCVW